jgi:hypothetical protein
MHKALCLENPLLFSEPNRGEAPVRMTQCRVRKGRSRHGCRNAALCRMHEKALRQTALGVRG